MICGTVHSFASNTGVRVSRFIWLRCQRAHPYHSSPTAWRPHVLTTPWETITHRRSGPTRNVRSAYGSCRVD
jgi:hypothetical protein